MAERKQIEIKTTNKNLTGPEGKKGREIAVTVTAEVPTNVEEAVKFYDGEENFLKAIQQDVARRRANAARPLIRDAESEMDWQAVAQRAVDEYQPGRRGGFGQPVEINEAELAGATNMTDLLAILRAKGISITSGEGAATAQPNGAEENEEEEQDVLEPTGD